MNQYSEPTADAIDDYLADNYPAWTVVRDQPLFDPKVDRGNGIRRLFVSNGERTIRINVFYDSSGVTRMPNPQRRADGEDESKAMIAGTLKLTKRVEPSGQRRWTKPSLRTAI